ncbi:MFS transporter [Paenibacillus sp. J31TS4]|nr:MFS transporter [Paenibacillus sp. J31TS4]
MSPRDSGAPLKAFSFTFYMMMAVTVSVFPIYFSSLGYSKMQIGVLYSIGPTVGIISNLFWGFLSDKLQRIRIILFIVLSGQLAAALLLFQFDAFSVVFVIMTAFYFFQTPLGGLTDSQILLTVARNGKSYASYRVWGSFGFAFASVAFGLLLKELGGGYVPYFSIGTLLVTLLLVFGLKDQRSTYTKMDFSGLFQVLTSPRLIRFLLLCFILALAARVNDGFLALYLMDLGAGEAVVGYAWMASAISETPMFFLLSRYGHRYKELPLLGFAALAYAIRFFLMSIVHDPNWIIATQALHSFSFGIFLFTALRYLTQLVPDRFRATGQAVFNVMWGGFAGLISGALGGRVFDYWGGQTLYLIAAACAAAACLGFFLTHILKRFQE